MMPSKRSLSGWGRFPVGESAVSVPGDRVAVVQAVSKADRGTNVIARGLGRAYGDSAQVAGGTVIETSRIDRFLGFDLQSGLLEVEAGVSFAEIIATFLPRGWFLPTTPGTKFVTVGGAIAADVHGKNHHRHGSLGMFVDHIDLVIADGSLVRCSRGELPDLFYATLGGMGLTGMIVAAGFRLVRLETSRVTVDYRRTTDLEETLTVFEAGDAMSEHSVAWIDCMASGRAMGRSVVMQGRNTPLEDLSPEARREPYALPRKLAKSVPFTPPVGLLNAMSVRAFNEVFYAAHGNRRKVVDIDTFFYPLDSIRHWNRLYGPRGFIQYQAFFPRSSSLVGLRELLSCIVASGAASFLAVLKSCGPSDGAMLSFLEPGHTLALDIPYRRGVIESLCARLDRILLDHGGRLYLAKDALMDGATFRSMYPRLDEFLAVKRRYDPEGLFASSQSRRLGITPA